MTKNIQENEGQYVVARRRGILGSVLKKNGRLSDWKSEKDRPIPPANKREFFRRTRGEIRPEISGFKPETQAQIDSRVAALNRSGSGSGRNSPPPASAPTSRPAPPPPASAPTPPPSSRPAPTPPPSSRPAPTPPAPPIERRMSAVTGKQEYVGTTSSGQKFERRAATRAELEAARKARDEAKKAGSSPAEAERAAVTAGIKATQKESKMIKEPYDLVLEYLFSQGHVDTLDEAHYVMLQMDSNYIQSIVEGGGPLLPGEPGKAPSSGYKEPILPGEQRTVKYMKKPAPSGPSNTLPPA